MTKEEEEQLKTWIAEIRKVRNEREEMKMSALTTKMIAITSMVLSVVALLMRVLT